MLNPIDPWAHGDALTAAHLQQQVEAINQISALLGGDGLETMRTPGGSTVRATPPPPAPITSFFPVKVEKTGGSDGNATTAASWVYTVRRIDWTAASDQATADFELGTSVAVVRPREDGMMTQQAGTTGYGVAFYDESGTIKLWDAGEIPTTTASCA